MIGNNKQYGGYYKFLLDMYLLLLSCILSIFPAYTVLAEDKILEITLDKQELNLNSSLRIDFTFYGIENMPAPELPKIRGFKSTYLRSTTIMSKAEDGKTVYSTRHSYVLMPQEVGIFELGPFDFSYNGIRYTSKQIPVKVTGGTLENQDNISSSKEQRFKVSENIFLLIEPAKETVYVNEAFPVAINLYDKDIKLTEVQSPVFLHEGFSTSEFGPPAKSKKNIKGYDYNVISFHAKIFATRPGELILGPASLTCSILEAIGTDLSRTNMTPEGMAKMLEKYSGTDIVKNMQTDQAKRSLRIESTPKKITAKPLPIEGMPEGFSGGVGNFNFDLRVEPTGYVKTSDPITLTMEISGEGNIDMISAPTVKEDENLVLYEPRLKEQTQGRKVFEQIIVPKATAFKKIPIIKFSYFDPVQMIYKTIERGGLDVTVVEGYESKKAEFSEKTKETVTETEGNTEAEETALTKDIVYIKDSPGKITDPGAYLYKNRLFLMVQPLPLFIFLATVILYKKQERLKNDIEYARKRIAYKKAKANLNKAKPLLAVDKSDEFYERLFVAIQEYIGDKFNIPSGGITEGVIDEVLRPKAIDKDIQNRLRSFFRGCDTARFMPSQREKKEMMRILDEAQYIIEYFRKV